MVCIALHAYGAHVLVSNLGMCGISTLNHAIIECCDCAQLLSAYTLMASKSRPDIEAAVGQLLDMANTDPNNVPVLMGLAHGFLLLKQTAKARNQLKVSGCSGTAAGQLCRDGLRSAAYSTGGACDFDLFVMQLPCCWLLNALYRAHDTLHCTQMIIYHTARAFTHNSCVYAAGCQASLQSRGS